MGNTRVVTRTPFPAASRSTTPGAAPLSTDPTDPSETDLAMVAFLRRWYVYGGGRAEDILVEFGLTPHEFFGRVKVLLENGVRVTDRALVEPMLTVCRKRLWLGQ